MPYRLIYIGLALVGIAAVILGIVLSPEGESAEIPPPIESLSPAPGSQVPPQATLIIDLEVGYDAEIVVDGWPIADAEFEPATGVYRWAPSPNSPTIQEWTPGTHTVQIIWNTYTGLPDTGRYQWTFRVG
ncbi:MAG TPA: hypothetical protein VJ858_01785 [Acidimicrobiia bacterium]|nr:hypothetical protein [Acidimicrobiia bacterium]